MSEYKGNYIVQNMSTEYDTSNRVSALTYKVDPNLGGTLESSRSHGYTYDDSDGTRTKLVGPDSGSVNYTYDGLKRLSTKIVKNSSAASRVSKTYTYLAGSGTNVSTTLVSNLLIKNGTSTVSSATYAYDAVGNITSITDSYLDYTRARRPRRAVLKGNTETVLSYPPVKSK